MTLCLAAALAGLAVLFMVPGPTRIDGPKLPRAHVAGAMTAVGSSGVVFLLLQLSISWVLVVVLAGAAAAGVRTFRRRRERRAMTRRRDRVLVACEGLAADLAAGLSPHRALLATAEEWPELRPVADAAGLGADVPAAFRAVALLPGAGMLRTAAAAWAVAHRSGASLADAVGLAADTVRAERDTARIVSTELAAATATARLLALLPLGVLVLGRGMGGDPFRFLLATTAGQICLASGLGLSWVGSIWLERIADSVEQS